MVSLLIQQHEIRGGGRTSSVLWCMLMNAGCFVIAVSPLRGMERTRWIGYINPVHRTSRERLIQGRIHRPDSAQSLKLTVGAVARRMERQSGDLRLLSGCLEER